MEHRLSARIAWQQPVIVDCPRVGREIVTAHNIGLGGMFVGSPALLLPPHAFLTVAFRAGVNGRCNEFVFNAMVVRHTETGAALMFPDLDVDVLRALRAALSEPAETSRPTWSDQPELDQSLVSAARS